MSTSTPSTGLRSLIATGIFGALGLSFNAVGAADPGSASITRRNTYPPIEQLTLMRHVSYSDLDLATYSGATELKKRVRDIAQKACKQLDDLHPLEGKSTPECVSKAVADASLEVDAAIAAAEREAKAE